jgi:hypothetical protein
MRFRSFTGEKVCTIPALRNGPVAQMSSQRHSKPLIISSEASILSRYKDGLP